MEQTPTTTSAAGGMRVAPPLVALLCLVGALGLHMMMPGARTVWPHHIVGLLLVATGVGFSCYAAAIFQARGTTKEPSGEPTSFVTAPPYTFTRNPMYLGVTTVLLGFAVFFGAAEMLLAPIVFFVFIDRIVIPREEETMQRLFGEQYRDYQARVRRWL